MMSANLSLFFLAVALAGDTRPMPPAGGPKATVWLTDYALALKEAKASGKPIFAVFR